jgi:hypothetical protein
MPRILTKLKVHEISAVDRGAGEGVRVVLMKRDDSNSDLKIDNNGIEKMTRAELFSAWWRELTEAERARHRRQQADIDAQLAEEERISRAGTTTRAEVAPSNPKPWPKQAREGDSLRKIVKVYGVMPLAGMINEENNAHGISESEFIQFVGEYAATKNQTVGALLSAANGEGALLSKALAICRYAGYAKQAESNLLAARMRQRG